LTEARRMLMETFGASVRVRHPLDLGEIHRPILGSM
jgi:hypothetical protein